MKLDSYWLDTAPRFSAGVEGPVEGRVDAVIVGGGLTGLSAALALGRRGASVMVLEAGRIAHLPFDQSCRRQVEQHARLL